MPDVERLLAGFVHPDESTSPTTLAEARVFHDRLALAFNGTGPADVAVAGASAHAADGHAVPLRVYEPSAPGPAHLLWIHGGGFVFGSLDSADSICRRLAQAVPCSVVSVDYRLGPEHTAAQSRADVDAAWQWMLDRAAARGRAAALAVGGDSAGATLGALLAHRLRDRGLPPPRLQLLAYPVTAVDECIDAVPNSEPGSMGFPYGVLEWLAGESASSPAVSLLRATLAATGPVHLVCGTDDFLADQNVRYVDALRDAGVVVTADFVAGMPHGFFPWDCDVSESIAAVENAVMSLRRALLDPPASPDREPAKHAS